MRTLDLLVTEHEGLELARNQPGFVDGLPVTIQCALELTAVIRREGEPAELVYLGEVEADGRRLKWVTHQDAAMNKSRERGRQISLAGRRQRRRRKVA